MKCGVVRQWQRPVWSSRSCVHCLMDCWRGSWLSRRSTSQVSDMLYLQVWVGLSCTACVCVCVSVNVCVCVWVSVSVCAICCCTFLYLQFIYLYYIYMCVQIRVWYVWLRTTLVCLPKLLYVNSCMVWWSYGLKPFYFVHCMCLYIFLQLFVQHVMP